MLHRRNEMATIWSGAFAPVSVQKKLCSICGRDTSARQKKNIAFSLPSPIPCEVLLEWNCTVFRGHEMDAKNLFEAK
jgi:hypothetical protein